MNRRTLRAKDPVFPNPVCKGPRRIKATLLGTVGVEAVPLRVGMGAGLGVGAKVGAGGIPVAGLLGVVVDRFLAKWKLRQT